MTDRDRVIELIESSQETDFCDFKREFYHSEKRSDMIKDILAFANSTQCGDKYIIFNIDDKTRQLGEMKDDIVPDISEINGLLREYCEPHITIEMETFFYKNTNVAYIKIPAECTDKPYLVKRDYERKGKVLLQQGQVFLRRNSDNYKANRRDLDEIYESRIKHKVEICKDEIIEKEFVIRNQTESLFSLDFIFDNNATYNYLINKIQIFFRLSEYCFSTMAICICDTSMQYIGENDIMNDILFSVEAKTTIQKRLRFKISNTCYEQMKRCTAEGDELAVWLEVQDVKGRKVCSEEKKCRIKFI